MKLYPAIELRNGMCVHRIQGEMGHARVFNTTPVEQAKEFEKLGCSGLQVINLDGATGLTSANETEIKNLLGATSLPVHIAGGIRTLDQIDYWIGRGAAKVVVGTIAHDDPETVRQACQKYPEQIIVAIDACEGFVMRSGWIDSTRERVLKFAMRYEQMGAAGFLYTDVNPDGGLSRINLEHVIDLAFSVTTPIIPYGCTTNLQVLRELKNQEAAGIDGVVIGRALYNGRIDPKEALDILQNQSFDTIANSM